jgi:hypothetical protein
MKTKILVAVAVVAVLIVGVLSLNYYLTPNPHVEITSFNTTKTSSGSSLGVVNVRFVLNLTNIGTGDVKNLTVTFSTNTTIEINKQLVYINSTSPYDHIADLVMGESCLLGGLRTGEAKEFMFYWAVSVGSYAPSLTATVKSNQAILDQETATIPPIPNVKITNFIYLGKWHGTRLGGAIDLFSLSYTNLGTINVEDLTVTLNTTKTNEKDKDSPYPTPKPIPGYNTTVFLDEYLNGETYTLESLKAGKTKTLEKTYFMFGAYNSVKPFALTATLKSNDTILDQATIMIPISIAA